MREYVIRNQFGVKDLFDVLEGRTRLTALCEALLSCTHGRLGESGRTRYAEAKAGGANWVRNRNVHEVALFVT
jgi:hypothetical protein